MTDVGFGLIDRRTVIMVLFTMVIAQLLFGFQIPVDTTNVGNLFIGLVLLTGYLYLARSIYRLPVALFVSVTKVVPDVEEFIKNFKEGQKQLRSEISNAIIRELATILAWMLLSIEIPLFFLIELFFLTFTFGEWIEEAYRNYFYSEKFLQISDEPKPKRVSDIPFKILDRIGLICIAVVATVPSLNHLVKGIGLGGLIIMVLVFTLRGDFTALVEDIIGRKEKDDDNKKMSASTVEIKSFRSSPMYVEIVNSNENPVGIYNSKSNPLSIDTGYGTNPLPVNIQNLYPLSVQAVSPLPVHVVNDVQVEVTNVVTTQQDD